MRMTSLGKWAPLELTAIVASLIDAPLLTGEDLPQIAQRKIATQPFHAIVPLLEVFKSEQQPLELIFPGKGPLDPHT